MINSFCYSATYYTAQNGSITLSSTWLPGNIPQIPNFTNPNNKIYINHLVFNMSNSNFTINSNVVINQSGVLNLFANNVFINDTIIIYGQLKTQNDVEITSSGYVDVEYSGKLNVNHDLIVKGIIDTHGNIFVGHDLDIKDDGEMLIHYGSTYVTHDVQNENIVNMGGGSICWGHHWNDNEPIGSGVILIQKCYGSISPLGITLTAFEPILIDKVVEITWTTENEYNNDHFIIEKSKDLNSWVIVDSTIKGSLFSKGTLNYKTYDYYPYIGISYYRLSQIDINGDLTTYNNFLRYISVMNIE